MIRRSALIVLALGVAALAVKQGIAIARYGYGGWLRGDGGQQTEWEVRAVIFLFAAAAGVGVYLLLRFAMPLADRFVTWRMIRAIEREQPSLREGKQPPRSRA